MLDDLRDLYQEVILDHGKNPRNFGHAEGANREAKGENPMCGDKFVISLRVSDDGIVEDCHFMGRGCAISTASASMMTEIVKGHTVAEAETLFNAFHDLCTRDEDDQPDHPGVDEDAMERLQVMAGVRQFPVRVKCATLAWHAMRAALAGADSASSDVY